jgi:hypothetical protein
MDSREALLSTFREEVIESLANNDQVTSTIPGIEYVKPGAKVEQKKICVATYSRKIDTILPRELEVAGILYRIAIISSDLPDTDVQVVPMCTFDDKE